jgi:hypothetical protein
MKRNTFKILDYKKMPHLKHKQQPEIRRDRRDGKLYKFVGYDAVGNDIWEEI